MTSFRPKKYHIKTYGCQANIADSNRIGGILESLGFEQTKDLAKCDVLVVNTCSVRQKSEDKAYGMGKILKEHTPFTIMAGCMVGSATGDRQRYKFEELKKRTSWVDAYINPKQIGELPTILNQNNLLDEWALKKFDPTKVNDVQEDNIHAYINISTGCDNFCTFCVVPYARGQEESKTEEEILKEIEHYVDRGFTQFTLCGQNVNSWGLSMDEKFDIRTNSNQKLPFATLLRKIHDIKGVEIIDFLSSNPFDFTQDLIDAIKLPKITNYLHIAVQSGNDDVLKKMNRRHTIADFKKLIKKLMKTKKDIEFGTDIIVGFPGETREQFMDTVQLFKDIKFNVAFISMYSPRKGTPAARFYKDDVPVKEKKWRHSYLTKVWNDSKR